MLLPAWLERLQRAAKEKRILTLRQTGRAVKVIAIMPNANELEIAAFESNKAHNAVAGEIEKVYDAMLEAQ